MSHFLMRLKSIYLRITGSIAFWPSIIALAFMILSGIILSINQTQINDWIIEHLEYLAVTNPENARLILGTLAGGTISLTVFSFTMVMVVLNQAGSNLSPRVIPGLMTKRPHQIVLGFYLGTTIYLLLLLLSFEKADGQERVTIAGILLALVFGIICLALFVYFINSISRAVQVNAVLNDIYRDAMLLLRSPALPPKDKHKAVFGRQLFTSSHYTIRSSKSGYLADVDTNRLLNLANKHNLLTELVARNGDFIQPGQPLLGVLNQQVLNADIEKELHACFDLSEREVLLDNVDTAMKQISEIGARALSPGINDPGTAKTTIDLLTALLSLYITQPDCQILLDKQDTPRVYIALRPLNQLLTKYVYPLRHYGRDNLNVNLKLLYSLHALLYTDTSNRYHDTIHAELQTLEKSYLKHITLEEDRQQLVDAKRELTYP